MLLFSERFVFDVKSQGLMEVEQLIKFDPYMCVGADLLRRLYDEDKQNLSLTDDILWDFAACYPPDKAETFAEILGVCERCV